MGGIPRNKKPLMGLWTDSGSLGLSHMHHNTSIKIAIATYMHRHGNTIEEIANELNIASSTAKNYISRGKHLSGKELQFWLRQKMKSAWGFW